MSGDADRAARGYRAANETLDERPSAAARAAILAAAARHVQAGPRDAAAPIALRRIGQKRRWPMAAAAAVLLSTLAVMMATRTEQEMPTFTPPSTVAESSLPAAASAPKPGSAPPAAPAVIVADSAEAKANATASLAKTRPAIAEKPAVEAADSAPGTRDEGRPAKQDGDKVTAAVPDLRAKDEPAGRLPMAPPPAAQPATATPSEREAQVTMRAPEARNEAVASAETPAAAESRRAQRADVDSGMPAPLQRSPSPALGAVAGQARGEADAAAPGELRAEDWLEKIIKLRKAGRHDEADAELKRFRERHPQVQVPAEALAPSGTR